MRGYLPGETVDVVVDGPSGYAASCSATADDQGAWSCQVTLWDTAQAGGNYSYTSTGEQSGVSETGTFTDAVNFDIANLGASPNPVNVGSSTTLSGDIVQNGNGNPINVAGIAGTITVFSAAGCTGTILSGPTNVTTNASGHFSASYTPGASGTQSVQAAFNSQTGGGTQYTEKNSPQCAALTVNAGAINTTTTAANASATFGDSSVTLNATVTPASGPAINSGSVTFTVNGVNVTDSTVVAGAASVSLSLTGFNAGQYNISAVYNPGSAFNGSNNSAQSPMPKLTLSQAGSTTTVTCPAGPVTYTGAALTPCTYTVTGAGGLSLGPTAVPAGNYSNNVNVGTASTSFTYPGDANHASSSDSKTFSIGQAGSTTTVTCPAGPVTYTGVALTPCTYTVIGAGGLSLGPTAVPAGNYSNNTNVGTASASFSYPGDTNHTGSSDSKTFSIGQAGSTTTVSCPASAVYNGSSQGCSASVAGPGLSQGLTVTYTGRLSTSYGPSTTAPTNAGDYTASASFAGDANHTGSNNSANFSIAKAPVTATAGSGSHVFDNAAHSPSACAVTGAYTGDLTCTNSPSSVGPGTGTTTIVPVVSGTGLSNFTITPVDGSYSITSAGSTTTVTCSGAPFTYSASQHGCSASWVSMGADGQGGSLTVTYIGINGTVYGSSTTAPTNAGDYEASASFGGDANHTGSNDTEDFTIQKANADCSSITGYGPLPYDALSHGATGSCFGVGPDSAAAGSSLAYGDSFTDVPGGTAHWVFTGGTNYNDQSGDAAIDISKADANCSTITGYNGVYDAAPHGATGSCTGVDALAAAAGSSLAYGDSFTDVPGGTAHWVFTGGTNYNDQSGDAAIHISKADADCSTIAGYSVTYDTNPHTATGACLAVDGLTHLAGLDLSGTTHTNAGSYNGDPWTFTDQTGNYNDNSGTVDDSIGKADADCSSITGYSVTFDGNAHTALGACYALDGTTALAGLDKSGTTHTNAGAYNSDAVDVHGSDRQLQRRLGNGRRLHCQG